MGEGRAIAECRQVEPKPVRVAAEWRKGELDDVIPGVGLIGRPAGMDQPSRALALSPAPAHRVGRARHLELNRLGGDVRAVRQKAGVGWIRRRRTAFAGRRRRTALREEERRDGRGGRDPENPHHAAG
jgi:hypothetical protein